MAASMSASGGSWPVSRDLLQQVCVARPEVPAQLTLESLHVFKGDVVDMTVRSRVDNDNLILNGQGVVQPLLEELGQSIAAIELGLGNLVELRAEGRERLQLSELRQVDLQRAGDGTHRLDLGGATHPGDGVADVHGRAYARVEEVCLEEDCPSVMEITFVGM